MPIASSYNLPHGGIHYSARPRVPPREVRLIDTPWGYKLAGMDTPDMDTATLHHDGMMQHDGKTHHGGHEDHV